MPEQRTQRCPCVCVLGGAPGSRVVGAGSRAPAGHTPRPLHGLCYGSCSWCHCLALLPGALLSLGSGVPGSASISCCLLLLGAPGPSEWGVFLAPREQGERRHGVPSLTWGTRSSRPTSEPFQAFTHSLPWPVCVCVCVCSRVCVWCRLFVCVVSSVFQHVGAGHLYEPGVLRTRAPSLVSLSPCGSPALPSIRPRSAARFLPTESSRGCTLSEGHLGDVHGIPSAVIFGSTFCAWSWNVSLLAHVCASCGPCWAAGVVPEVVWLSHLRPRRCQGH